MKKSGSNGEEIVTLGTGTGGGSANITGSQYFLPIFNSTSSLITSSIYQSGSFTAIRDTSPLDPTNPDILLVQGNGVNSYNLISAHGNLNSYVQVNVQNFSAGLTASADIVATNNIGDEESYFINMGINGDGYNIDGGIGSQNDAYLYSTGENLLIGNASEGKSVILFNGTGSAINNARVYINPGGTVGINTSDTNISNPESLLVEPLSNSQTDFNNLIVGKGIINENYLQLNITNLGTGSAASSDVVATNNIGDETSYYIDMGVNSSNYNIPNAVGTGSDAYLYSTARHLHIGNASNYPIQFFVGGLDSEANRKLQLNVNSQHELTGSLNATQGFTGSLFGTASWALNVLTASYAPNAVSSSYPMAVTGSSIYSNGLGSQAPIYNVPGGYFQDGEVIPYVIYLGYDAGRNANSSYATFIGYRAGLSASFSDDSVFIGETAGEKANWAGGSNFIGIAGYRASYAEYSNFMGYLAGSDAYTSSYSNFIGREAGDGAEKSQFSNFLGLRSGKDASQVNYSNFIGADTGRLAISSSYSNLLGYRVGYNIAGGANGIGTNNIIIGTNITLGTGRKDSINLGGLIFGTGSYATTTGNPFSGSANGRIGINQPNPIFNLDVSGSGRYTNGLTVTSSLLAPDITGSLFGTASWAVSASHALSSLTASFAISASYTVSSSNSQTSSYVNPLVQDVQITGSVDVKFGNVNIRSNANFFQGTAINGTSNVSLIGVDSNNVIRIGNQGYNNVIEDDTDIWGGLTVSGSSLISGSLLVTNGITGSLFGTASWALNVITASYILNAISASYAATASSADNFTVRGTLTAQTIVAQTITSSTEYVTGSTIFGSLLSNTHQFTGSVSITGSLAVNGSSVVLSNQTGSMSVATASFASTASYVVTALTASYVTASNVVGTVTSASFASTASIATSASFAATASYITASNIAGLSLSQITLGVVTASVNTGNNVFSIISGSNTLVVVDGTGSMGIGTTSPAYKLDVNGTARVSGVLKLFSGATAPANNYPLNAYVSSGGIASFEYGTTGFLQFVRAGASAGLISLSRGETYDITLIAGNFGSTLGLAVRPANIGGVKIGGDNTTIVHENSAMLNVESTTKGFLPPRMIAAQRTAISAPAQGLLVYDISPATEGLWLYNSGSTPGWQEVLTNTGSQSILGGLTATSFTGSLQGTSSWAQNAVTASYVANASSFPYTGSAIITGSLTVTGSTNLQVLNIGASQLNNTSSATTAGTTTVSSIATGSFTSAFYNYTIASGSNARAGQVMSVWSGGTIRYTEVTTTDIGNTATASFAVALSGANVNLSFTAPDVWTVKSIANLL